MALGPTGNQAPDDAVIAVSTAGLCSGVVDRKTYGLNILGTSRTISADTTSSSVYVRAASINDSFLAASLVNNIGTLFAPRERGWLTKILAEDGDDIGQDHGLGNHSGNG